MRTLLISLLAALTSSALALAQTCAHVPDNAANAGACNVIPFGDSAGSASWANQKYQTLIPAAQIGAVPMVIRELGFAPCGTGQRFFSTLTIKMDHYMGGTLTTTFASNLTASAVTVLNVTDYVWTNTADSWVPIGLQQPFVYVPPLGDLVIEIEVTGARMLVAATDGFHRSATLQRMYAVGWTGVAPATGASDLAGQKVQLCSDLASASRFGVGCPGSNNATPVLDYNGPPKLGSVTFAVQLSRGLPTAPAFMLYGSTNAPPYPIDLSVINMPGCRLYADAAVLQPAVTNSAGDASVPLVIPNAAVFTGIRMLNQFFLLDQRANGTGVSASNGGWMRIGL